MVDDWKDMPFSSAVLLNPPVPLEHEQEYSFVDMGAISVGSRWACARGRRKFEGGGSRFQNGDILMARITPCLENGKVARYNASDNTPLAHGSTEFIVVRGRPGVTETDFAYYLTQSPEVREYAISQMTGTSGRQRVPIQALEHLMVKVPPLAIQRAIAHILGTLDDKIELNRRMNETLEAMARVLFKSWFIDFDPVHAKAEGRDPGLPADIAALFPDSFQDSDLGEIPRGWTAGRFGNVVSQRTERLRDRPAVVLSAMAAGELVNSDEHFMKRVYSQEIGKYLAVEQWDFAYNPSRVNIGSIGMLKEPLLGGVSPVYVVFRPQEAYRWFVEFNLRQPSTKQWINTLASGSVRQSLSYADFASLPCVIPPETTVARFDGVWTGFRASILLRSDESRTQATLRDTLLPKLLSGELRVKHVGRSMEAQA